MNTRTKDWLRLLAWMAACATAALLATSEPDATPRDVSVPSDSSGRVIPEPVDSFYHMTPEQLRGTCDVTSDLQCQRNRPWRT